MAEFLRPAVFKKEKSKREPGSGSSSVAQPRQQRPAVSDMPVVANFAASNILHGAGVAIFHLASSRVVVCRHSVEGHWFLPKGRKDQGENICHAAEREGFEESGYHNRLLPLPIRHRQTGRDRSAFNFCTEPVWTQLAPVAHTVQYVLSWFIAETVPPDVESGLRGVPVEPPAFPIDMTIEERIALEPEGYEPVRHPNTGVDADEILYESYLLPVDEAMRRLRGSMQEHVIRQGWEYIQDRIASEEFLKKTEDLELDEATA